MRDVILSNACAAILLATTAHGAEGTGASSPTQEPRALSTATHEFLEVWVELSEPSLATLPREASAQRAALRERIVQQQDAIAAQLVALGGTELGRIQQGSNAIAVKLPAAAIERVKQIDGVIAVRAVSHRNRID